MKKIVMQNGEPKFILDTNEANYQIYTDLLKMYHDKYQLCDVKDINNNDTFYHNCNAYFDSNGKYKTKDGRPFHLEYDLYISKRENEKFPNAAGRIIRQSYDGKDGIHFMLPIYNISLEYIINTAATALPIMYKEKRVAIAEPEYIYAIYSCTIDSNGDKMMSLPYYTKDIKATQELINLENTLYESFNRKENDEWYEISEIDVQSNKNIAKFIKTTTKEITLDDVKNIKPCVTAYITTDKHKMDKYDIKWYSLTFNKTLYVSLYPQQPKIGVSKLNDVEYIDDAGFLHVSNSFFIKYLEDVENTKQTIYSYMISRAVKLLMTKNQHMK